MREYTPGPLTPDWASGPDRKQPPRRHCSIIAVAVACDLGSVVPQFCGQWTGIRAFPEDICSVPRHFDCDHYQLLGSRNYEEGHFYTSIGGRCGGSLVESVAEVPKSGAHLLPVPCDTICISRMDVYFDWFLNFTKLCMHPYTGRGWGSRDQRGGDGGEGRAFRRAFPCIRGGGTRIDGSGVPPTQPSRSPSNLHQTRLLTARDFQDQNCKQRMCRTLCIENSCFVLCMAVIDPHHSSQVEEKKRVSMRSSSYVESLRARGILVKITFMHTQTCKTTFVCTHAPGGVLLIDLSETRFTMWV